MTSCLFCDHPLPERGPAVPPQGRRAYDPWKGRLWDVCGQCGRWNPVPLTLRWEILEACEEASATRGEICLSTDQLALIRVDEGELIRVGTPQRLDFVGWRYGSRLPRHKAAVGVWGRLLAGLPMPSVGSYVADQLNTHHEAQRWFASPFLESAPALTAIFSQMPMAPQCPSCTRPLGLYPWDFQNVALVDSEGTEMVESRCAFCGKGVLVPLRSARPALRLALALVESKQSLHSLAESAAKEIGTVGGPDAFVRALSRSHAAMGELGSLERIALSVILDERAESEALDTEWLAAEEIAQIMDGELTEVPGFEAFKRRVLGT